MRYQEIEGDLFGLDPSYTLAHCISADAVMGAGIAVAFTSEAKGFGGNRAYVRAQHPSVGQAVFYEGDQWGVFNLITKEKVWQKPTYGSLIAALADMRRQVEKRGITKVAMPQIGCGLDRLEWSKVQPIIQATFEELDVEVLVVIWKPGR